MKLPKTAAQVALLLGALTTKASIVIPSDGSDGALNITTSTNIDLSQAVTAVWNADNSANIGKGVYDSNKWAVVFKYTSVNIAAGATVTFSNHPSRAPVVWLVQGGVKIEGSVSLDGQGYVLAPGLPEPGPGGFRGGSAFYTPGVGVSAGFGPGGGAAIANYGRAGSYGTDGGNADRPGRYGNPSLIPLIGGSGGSGDPNSGGPQGGGAGGGALLIACATEINIIGSLHSNGGNGSNGNPYSGGGSGGGIRLVCETLSGNGAVETLGGGGWAGGGLGRTRIERVADSSTLKVTPDTSPVALQADKPPIVWLPDDGPTARIVSIGSTNAPMDPRASFGSFGADVALPQVASTSVVVETTNAENASIVKVRVTPRSNGTFSETTAALTGTNSLTPLVLRWEANVPVTDGYAAVQVKVVRP